MTKILNFSRTYRKDRQTHKKVPDGKHPFKCRCSWCINIKWRDRRKEKYTEK